MRSFFNLFFSTLLIFIVGIAHAETKLEEIEQTLGDSLITAKITAKFAKNPELNPLKLSVSTKDGCVTLSGHVNNRKAFVNALRIAKNTTGVKAVTIEHLLVKPVNTALTDAYITAKAEAAILKAKVFDDESIPLVGINVTTTNGTVTLTGQVKKDSSAIAIIKEVNAVKGIKKIISHLEISKEG